MGRIDILVNNAGISPLYTSLDAVSEDLFDKTIAVNLKGPFRLSALVGTRMAAGDGGSIISISSTAAIKPRPAYVPYAAAKAGLVAMSEGLARAFGPDGPLERGHGRPVPHRHHHRLGLGRLQHAGQGVRASAASASLRRSSVPSSISPATPRATRPARSSGSTAVNRDKTGTCRRGGGPAR